MGFYLCLRGGVARMNFWQFNVYTFLGSWPWCYGLAYAGYKLGANWPSLEVYFREFDYVIGLLLLAGIAAYIWLHLKNRASEETPAAGKPPGAEPAMSDE